MTDRPNIYASDAAREAAFNTYQRIAGCVDGKALMEALDAFLSKSLEGADEKIAEIRKYAGVRKGISEFEVLGRHSKVVESHRDYLLTLVTALSVKLKEVEEKANAMGTDFLALIESGDERERALQSKLTVQKAAHAKMLRDEATKIRLEESALIASHIFRLAAKIEGGSE